ncbi:MAG: PH domain-containing protein [Hydrogenophaga sp.]|nr:PH domain-containing protein [Hydrogenophaga sp.]
MNAHHEHEFEAEPGLPERLPQGERLLWQGSPDWRTLAIHAFHVRKLAIYFAAMLGLQALFLLTEPRQAGVSVLAPMALSITLAVVALLLLAGTAYFSARTTLYTLTDRRILMRVGIVLTLTFNLPLKQISAAALRPQAKGHGDIALSLKGPDRIAYLNLWPHARAWQLKQPQPSLRCLPQALQVSERILRAWRAANPDTQAVVGSVASPAAVVPQPMQSPAPAGRARDRALAPTVVA